MPDFATARHRNMSFDPQTGWLYATAAVRPVAFMQRKYSLVNGLWVSSMGGGTPLGAKYSGTYTALDPTTNKIVWQKKTTHSLHQGSGTLSIPGGLLFHGEPVGNFQALHARTGDALFRWQTGPAPTRQGLPTKSTASNTSRLRRAGRCRADSD